MTAKSEFFLDVDHQLSPTKPKKAAQDSYDYDPAAPTPYIATYQSSPRRPSTYMIDDQRWASERADVATFTGPALA
ncbi:hypothetical protein ABTM13_19680, partial [Acinetobacter baumannii]